MSRYQIFESARSRVEAVHSYEDLEIHHPSKNSTGLRTGRVQDFEKRRSHQRVEGDFEEVRPLPDGRILVKKDFILGQDAKGPVRIPAPVDGYVHYLKGDPTAAVSIYDKPFGREGAKLLAQVLHMDPRTFHLQEGERVRYGQPIGTMSDKGSHGSIHAHVEAEPEQFKKYIRDIDSGVITPHSYPGNSQKTQSVDQPKPSAHHEVRKLAVVADGLLEVGDKGAEVQRLQQQLNGLGYRDAGDRVLVADGDFGRRTRQAVMAFQRDHGLADVSGVVGPKTIEALRHAGQSPLLSNPGHPDNAIYQQALRGLRQLPSETFNNDTERSNAAATLVFEARVSGMKQIDHVVLSTNGSGLFAVQGRLDDPAHSRIYLDRAQAAAQPVERSTEQLRQDTASQQQVQMQSQVHGQQQQIEHRGVALGIRP